MEKSLLKEIILEQKEVIDKKDKGIERNALFLIKKYLKMPHIVVIAGIRRVGKSTLLVQLMRSFYKDKCYYFNFEDERLLDFFSKDFNLLYESFLELFGEKRVFFFDEIQNIKGWENFVRRMQDRGFKFFITGSNASLLSKELGTKLTGRYILCELYPFSFDEFLRFNKYEFKENFLLKTVERGKLNKLFNEYLKQGGMPEYLNYKNSEILKKMYEDILYRDIVTRYEIKEVKSLRELSLYYLSNLANLFSYNKLKSLLKLGSVNTVSSYTDYLENSFLIFTTSLYSYSLKKQFVANKKVYCIDNNLANSISFRFSKDVGKFLENLVFIELKRRGKEIYYYRTENNLEIDFAIRKGRKLELLIQVAQSLNNIEIKEREVKALIKALKELKLKKGLILTENEDGEIKIDNKIIIIKSIYKWLLEDKSKK
ncbi:ATP-binding protein [Patescibacteria group bacterium]|nr:ATP-binding protein [Patescibacteria group bacterium]